MAFLTTLALSLIFVTAAAANDEPVVTIPLDQIWALDMAGTRDINEYDFSHDDPRIKGRDRLSEGRGITGQLRSKLWLKPLKQDALPAIILRQDGPKRLLPMLRTAGSTVNREESIFRIRFEQLNDRFLIPRTGFRFSLFFYSHPSAYRVEFVKVERRGMEIDVSYRFVPSYSAENSAHWALIPLGELPAGDYHVNINKLPMAQEFLDAGFQPVSEEAAKRIVCQPLDFHVRYMPVEENEADEEENGGKSVVIPLDQIWGFNLPGTRDILQLDLVVLPQPFGSLRPRTLDFLMPPEGKQNKRAGPGFAVVGSGQAALVAAHTKLPKGSSAKNTFSEEDEISAVFFGSSFFIDLHLAQVQRRGNLIEIRYQLLKDEGFPVAKFALIPLGKLPVGEYQVRVIPPPFQTNPSRFRLRYRSQAHEAVCTSYSFSVVKKDSTAFAPMPPYQPRAKPVTIPLETGWVESTPGVRKHFLNLYRRLDVRTSDNSISDWRDRKAGLGFAVVGTEQKALIAAYAELPENGDPKNTFSTDSEISVVFFTTPIYGADVRLLKVEQRGKTIEVQYRYTSNPSPTASQQLSLIPLGKLPQGKYRVKMIESGTDPNVNVLWIEKMGSERAQNAICRSFSFFVTDNQSELSSDTPSRKQGVKNDDAK